MPDLLYSPYKTPSVKSFSSIIEEAWWIQTFNSIKLSTLLSIFCDFSLVELQLSTDIPLFFKLLSNIIRSHKFLYASFGGLFSLLSRIHRNEAIVASINVSSLSRIRRLWKSSRSGREFGKTSEIIKSVFMLLSSLHSFLKRYVELLYITIYFSQSL